MNTHSTPPLACIVLAAGRGTRMKSALPKVLHPVGGQALLRHILQGLEALNPQRIVVVIAPDMDDVAKLAAPHTVAIQQKPLGSGDAARAGINALQGFDGKVLIVNGDMPLITTPSLQALCASEAELAVMTTQTTVPDGYGRVVIGSNGQVQKIVEHKDATAEERAITRINAGGYAGSAQRLRSWLATLKPNNAQGEYYLTDIVPQASETKAVDVPFAEVQGVNNRVELAACEKAFQARMRVAAMENGVTLIDPETVYFAADTQIAADVVVHPHVVFGAGVKVESGAVIKPFCHLEGVYIGAKASVGPYARLRPGTHVGAGAYVGNFIEIKNSTLHQGVKAGHVGYLGDATLGAGTNVGAGTITANYDGVNKHKTVIGENVMLGVHTSLVAPVQVGSGAYIAAGSTITKDVESEALVVARADQKQIKGWATKRNQTKKKDH